MVVEDVGVVSSEVQTSASSHPASTSSTSGSKTSLFVKKAGFIIPKNKRSGSLVPALRGIRKPDSELITEELSNRVQRKTKWGPDLTLDSSVRKARALAYQARLNQISEQLTIGTLDLEDNDEFSVSENGKKSNIQISNEESELLVHERREIIGEILKLNPAYKPPADHKPLMKESKIPIPIKEHPGYNFLGSLFGTAADTLKKLEKETGARVKVYGVKADSEGKVEITAADGKDASAVAAYEDLYVHVSADAFEKLDAAVALVELLLTPVSGNNPVSSATAVRMDDDSAEKNVDAQPATTTVVHSQAAAVSAPPPGSSQQAVRQFPHHSQAWLPPVGSSPLHHHQVAFPPPPLNAAPNTSLPVSGLQPAAIYGSQNPSVVVQPAGYMQPAPPSLGEMLRNTSLSTRPPPAAAAVRWPSSSPQPQPQPQPQQGGPNLMPIAAPSVVAGPNAALHHTEPAAAPSGSNIQPSSVGPPPVVQYGGIPGPVPLLFQGNPRGLQPSAADFAFHPNHRPPPPIPTSPQVWQNRPLQLQQQPPQQLVRQPLLPMVHNFNNHGYPRPMMSNEADQPRLPYFTGRPPPPLQVGPPPPRHHHHHHHHHHHNGIQPRQFFPPPNPAAAAAVNNRGFFPQMPQQQIQRFPPPPPPTHLQRSRPFTPPMMSSSSRVHHYDHPVSANISNNPHMGGVIQPVRVPNESDPEYEDLMASVGVK